MIEERSPDEADAGLLVTSEVRAEQDFVARCYERLESYRASISQQLAEIRRASAAGTHQWRTERDALARNLERRLVALAIGDSSLCFGRLDLDDGSRLHIGRIGVADADQEPLLVDWRAPLAALFYRATSGSPEGVVRRRHLLTKGREVIDIDDEVFDLSSLSSGEISSLHGDAALLAAVGRARTGQMGDIVATIQREQDAVIRTDLSGVLVVQGGPGTGKTAVALHRAAYLLYAHRTRLVQTGVLVVGPNPVFLHYIEQVLPSLGETGALLSTPQGLYPGVRTALRDSPEVAALKGDEVMVGILQRAIADRQRVPRNDLVLIFERSELHLSRAQVRRARDVARQRRRTHNQARPIVESLLLDRLVSELAETIVDAGGSAPGPDELRPIRRSLARSRDFKVAMERIWPVLTPEQLLNDLFGTAALLRSATVGVDAARRELLSRSRRQSAEGVAWTVDDVPLLDEAAELLGSATDAADRRNERLRRLEHRSELAYAKQVLGTFAVDVPVDVEMLADRFTDASGDGVANQAANDRTWKFGHVIVDEAQEISPMAWRMIFRRNPNRSMTIVGDLAQSGAPWAPENWGAILDRYATGNWRLTELTVNYRTPSEIMQLAEPVLAIAAPGVKAPAAIRDSDYVPRRVSALACGIAKATAAVVADELRSLEEGRLAVLAPQELVGELAAALEERLPEWFARTGRTDDDRVVLLGVREAKGLEFDAVVVVEPDLIVNASPRGRSDLYVALTRATQRLALVHELPLPPELGGLSCEILVPVAVPD